MSDSKVWRGPQDGLPPAGIKCEFNIGNGEWTRVFTVGLDDDGHVVVQRKNHGYDCSMNPEHFHPIRTPEQIAAEEREKECDTMLAFATVYRDNPDVYEVIDALYDAGYRKQGDVTEALRKITEAYRSLVGLDGAYDEALVNAERVLASILHIVLTTQPA